MFGFLQNAGSDVGLKNFIAEYIQTVANIKEKYPNHSVLELAQELIKNETLESK